MYTALGAQLNFVWAKIFWNEMKKKVIQRKSIKMGDFTHRYCRYRIVTTTL